MSPTSPSEPTPSSTTPSEPTPSEPTGRVTNDAAGSTDVADGVVSECATGDGSTGDSSTGNSTTGDSATGGGTTSDSTTGDSSTGGGTTGDSSTGDGSAVHAASDGPTSMRTAHDGPAFKRTAHNGPTSKRTAPNVTVADGSAREQTTADVTVAEVEPDNTAAPGGGRDGAELVAAAHDDMAVDVPHEARWVRPFLVAAAALALLFVGAAAGLFLGGFFKSSGSVTPAPDSVDVGFLQDMSVHHLQAVEMAAWTRDHTENPAIAQLSTDLEKTQNNQVGRMQGYLELWRAAPLPTGTYMWWMTGADSHSHGGGTPSSAGGVTTMPGMASQQDLTNLRAATGEQLDVLFLQLMLRHHEGGAPMLQYASVNAETPEVRNQATQMLASQTAESQYMRQLLAERGAQPLPL